MLSQNTKFALEVLHCGEISWATLYRACSVWRHYDWRVCSN